MYFQQKILLKAVMKMINLLIYEQNRLSFLLFKSLRISINQILL